MTTPITTGTTHPSETPNIKTKATRLAILAVNHPEGCTETAKSNREKATTTSHASPTASQKYGFILASLRHVNLTAHLPPDY
jgi:hypothetical protein